MKVTSNLIFNFCSMCLIAVPIISDAVNDLENVNQTEKILSRKRRYLIFPRGASVQMVYDQIIPIVDYTNLFILGVTCALAWELPENPVHLSEELMNKYKNGTLPLLLKRNDENITENNLINNYGYDSFYNHNEKFNFDDWNDNNDHKMEFGTKYYEPWSEKISGYNGNMYDYNHDQQNVNVTEQKLSRKRRYLIFPTGSSVQLIMDVIISIVDYTNLFTLGITSALAWELPTEPFDPTEDIIKQYMSGTLPLLMRKDDNITDSNYYDYHKHETNTTEPNYHRFYDSYYNQPYLHSKNSYYANEWNDANRKNNFRVNRQFWEPWQENKQSSALPILNDIATKPWHRHRVYPAMGKRSVTRITPTEQSFEEIFYLNYHRTSRHSLYKSIEKYLKAHNKDGVECLHKALCLTGQKQHDNEPSTFVAEIMRVIFSLPSTPLLNTRHNKEHTQYDEAYFQQQNCTEKYSKCKDNLYEADFIY